MVKKSEFVLECVTGRDEKGRECFHFMLMPQENVQLIKSQKVMDLKDLGIVVKSGYGTPTDADVSEAKQLLAEKHMAK